MKRQKIYLDDWDPPTINPKFWKKLPVGLLYKRRDNQIGGSTK